MPFTVGDLAKLTGVTVRALHHYDEIGLVRPSQRTTAGYRLYDDADVHRLQQVLLFRELGLPLDEIAAAIDQATARDELLRQHRSVLLTKRARIDAMLASLDNALTHLQENRPMQPDDIKSMFDGFDHTQYEDEARENWGDSDAYKESARRTKSYGKPEWDQIRRDWAAIYADLAAELAAHTPVTDPRVQAIVERHRQHLERSFYPCSLAFHKNLGAMYVADPRFAANIEGGGALGKTAPGLAQYLSDAIAAS